MLRGWKKEHFRTLTRRMQGFVRKLHVRGHWDFVWDFAWACGA
jgi:hypothetical protein